MERDRYKVLALKLDGGLVEIGVGSGAVPVVGDVIRAKLNDGMWELTVCRRVFDTEALVWEVIVKRDHEIPVPVTP